MSNTLRFEGIVDLSNGLKKRANLDDVRRIVKLNGKQLENTMKIKARFKGHYRGKKFIKPTGTTKRSIKLTIEDNGFTAKVAPGTEYSYWLEKGTRFMEAQPFVGPAFYPQKEKFKRDMERIMK